MQNRTNSGTIYVLVPIPSINRAECTTQHPYIHPKGCEILNKQLVLSSKNHEEMMAVGKSLLKRLQSKERDQDVYPKLLTFANSDILKSLTDGDFLYVTAHGCPYAIGTKYDGVNLTPKLLAAELHKAGLSYSLSILKIMGCNSGIDPTNIDVFGQPSSSSSSSSSAPELGPNQTKSYAEIFLDEISVLAEPSTGRKRTNLNVVGYLGEVTDGLRSKKHNDVHTYTRFYEDDNNPTIRASQARVWFFSQSTLKDKKKADFVEAKKEENELNLELLRATNL